MMDEEWSLINMAVLRVYFATERPIHDSFVEEIPYLRWSTEFARNPEDLFKLYIIVLCVFMLTELFRGLELIFLVQ